MRSTKAIIMAVLAVAAISVGTVSSTLAAARHDKTDALVIKITKSDGTVWGKVTVDYKSGGKEKMLGACSKASCELHPPHMVKLTLKESPTHPMTWPFHAWKLTNGGMKATPEMGKTLKFEIENGMATAKAIYVAK